MTDVILRQNFLGNARAIKLMDTASITWSFDPTTNTLTGTAAGGGGDHGALTGLGDDDHAQYLTQARAFARMAVLF